MTTVLELWHLLSCTSCCGCRADGKPESSYLAFMEIMCSAKLLKMVFLVVEGVVALVLLYFASVGVAATRHERR